MHIFCPNIRGIQVDMIDQGCRKPDEELLYWDAQVLGSNPRPGKGFFVTKSLFKVDMFDHL